MTIFKYFIFPSHLVETAGHISYREYTPRNYSKYRHASESEMETNYNIISVWDLYDTEIKNFQFK